MLSVLWSNSLHELSFPKRGRAPFSLLVDIFMGADDEDETYFLVIEHEIDSPILPAAL